MKELVVLLPTLNEEKAITKVIKAIPITALKRMGYKTRVLVVDGHSKDNTVKKALNEGARVIMQEGRGKGSAIRTAFKELRKEMPDAVVMMDADNTYDPRDMPKLLLPILIGEADIVIGAREKKTHFIGNALLTLTANIAFRGRTRDLCSGYWAFNTKSLKLINIKANGFDVESDLFAQANKHNLRIESVNIKYRERIGESKLNRSDAIKIFARIIRNIRDWHPLMLFGTSGLIILIISIIFGFRVVNDYLTRGYVNAIGTAIFTIFTAITGFFLIGMGLILDLMEQKR